MPEVYASTTAPNPKTSWLMLPTETLEKARGGIKVIQVLLSFVAFILEEMVISCSSCSALYFFEFVSCSAFLFTLLLLILLYTSLNTRVGISCWPKLDFVYTAVIAVVFLLSSIIFTSSNSDTTLERSAVAFGFLASLMFFLDLILFVKSAGFPFQRDVKPESSNGGTAAEPETAKLNTPASATD
ncbi:CKLF-like MARVEL transmembrane domain-containing protein 6 [Anarrhichthys ocellatus]|uniref:CKLF-like MARVEL transmembrane domain-containing protein 6 n=1 Tax=Anarrhichthys ocellatus TaxID=433405 RepID=UPI0012EE047C|nr:CKLF-like MARVEL transmembrane domain-containing protein 6 [Anarrhichthys ocellatus]XP_031733147.1 CKLF-like MARVEL transmembrane domain-containing protein 6 [Anarrhichthys ocellatus]